MERAKIALSAASEHRSTLDYIARDLHADSSADGLAAAAHGYLEQIRELLAQVRSDIGGDPDAVFLTGGMSRAGYLRQAVAAAFPAPAWSTASPRWAWSRALRWRQPARINKTLRGLFLGRLEPLPLPPAMPCVSTVQPGPPSGPSGHAFLARSWSAQHLSRH